MDTLTYTPSSALGSCRYKMKDWKVDEEPYKRLLIRLLSMILNISSISAEMIPWIR